MAILYPSPILRKCQLCSKEKLHEVRARTQLPLPACLDCMAALPPVPEGKKRCPRCLAVFEEVRTQWGSRTYCKECANIRRKTYYKSDKGRDYNLRQNHDLTLEEFNLMLFQQAGVCAICHGPETMIDGYTGKPRPLSVDHDHQTGRIRGLLCNKCNTMLGRIETHQKWFDAILKYKKKHDKLR